MREIFNLNENSIRATPSLAFDPWSNECELGRNDQLNAQSE